MRRTSMGYVNDEGKRFHDPTLTDLESLVLDTIATYNQRLGGAPAPMDLVAEWCDMGSRSVRELINHLIQEHRLPIYPLPGPGGGYFLGDPGNLPEARRAVHIHLARVITGGRKARALGASAAELGQSMVQLTLDLPADAAQEVAEEMSGLLADAGLPMSHAAVAHTLGRYQGDPQRYAEEINDLAEQFGGLFIRREDLQRVLAQHLKGVGEKVLAELGGQAA